MRRAAIRILSAQSEHIPFRSLLAVLDDKDEDVRWTAIEILRTQGKRVSLEVLGVQGERIPLEFLRDSDKNWQIRWASIQVLKVQEECMPLESLLKLCTIKIGGYAGHPFKP